MNENPFKSLCDSSDDEALSRSIDRFADGECNAVEEAELFDRLDATPGAWKQCALALAEDRDLRAALAGVGRRHSGSGPCLALEEKVIEKLVLASSFEKGGAATGPHRRRLLSWSGVALGLLVAFAAGIVVSPRDSGDAPPLAEGQTSPRSDVIASDHGETNEDQRSRRQDQDLIASGSRSESSPSSANGPDIVNVVYRPSGNGEETSAPLPVYKSNEDWARALNQVVRLSEADLAERRAQLLAQGADLERQIVLHPVTTEQGEMLLPVETFQIVPISRKSFH